MAYSPTNWTDGTSPVDASNLNKLEQAVSDNSDSIDDLTSNRVYVSSATDIDGLLSDINSNPRYSITMFGGGETANLTNALTNGASSSACRGFAVKMANNDNYIDYFVFSVNGRCAFIGRWQNDALLNLIQLNTTSIAL